MAYLYQPSSGAVHVSEEEEQSKSAPVTAVEHHFETLDFDDGDDGDSSLTVTEANDISRVSGLSTGMMIALTCGLGGLQLIWSAIFSHGSAYLFSLGITKSQSSLIWAVAPISGAVVQPIVGAIADNSRFRWGRRQPFIFGGTIGIVISLLALAWVNSIMRRLANVSGIHSPENIETTIQIGTIICVTLLNVSIQPLQLGLRALIIDVCPSEQQSTANAWAARFTGVGNILGFILGALPLGQNEAWRFRVLSLISVIILMITVLVTAYFIREDKRQMFLFKPHKGMLLLRVLRNVKDGWDSMPPQARRVCWVQFFSWMGRFGFLFYSTTYIARLYVNEFRRRGIEHLELLEDAGIRLGSFASLLSSIIALTTQVIAPLIATSSILTHPEPKLSNTLTWYRQTHILWSLSQLLFVLCTLSTMFITSATTAILVIALTGISWGVTGWAPFALLGEEIATHQAERDSAAAVENGDQQWAATQSGAMMGVHNAFISVPQILAAVGSSFIFLVCEGSGSGESEDDGIAWVLRCSGVPSLAAAWLAWRLK